MRDKLQESVREYYASLCSSERFGPQVAARRTLGATEADVVNPDFLLPELQNLLQQLGISTLYRHQAEAIQLVLAGHNVLAATPTASGKSLIYNLPVLTESLLNKKSRALYLFPLKALARDQLAGIEKMAALLPDHFSDIGHTAAAVYDGDTSPYMRRKIRDNLPAILISNPDMLHLSMLPYHENWGHLFGNLTHIIIDEVHTYRGVFGSHVSWLLRRLQRICRLYGSNPCFILSSATIGNPHELGEMLIDAPLHLITKSGAPSPPRNELLLNPLDSAPVTASMLLQAAVHRNLRTIVYTQSRRMTELISIWTARRLGEQKECVASYRAGFLPEDRRMIETRLADGSLLGVISTSALELGIDIGNLDICILVGYPGSIMAARQRAGRVGRSMQESLVVFVAGEDALDQHFMRNPEDYFDRAVEPVVINPDNPVIKGDHLVCMAAEAPLAVDDPSFDVTNCRRELEQLCHQGRLLQSASGNSWFATRKYPQRLVNLRGGGKRFVILTGSEGEIIGEVDGFRALRECHPGAIYLHRSQTYHVDSLDLDAGEVVVSEASPAWYTRVSAEKETEILETLETVNYGSTHVHLGRLRVTETITGYWRILSGSGRVIGRTPLDLPPHIFETEGFWIEIPDWIRESSEEAQLHFMGGIHALEHAMIGVLPLQVLCDRNDIGGISHPWHDQLQSAAVFVYDGHAGGVGLTRKAFAEIEKLMNRTIQVVEECPCDLGCPSCVHSPKCGSGNRPIDKQTCLRIAEQLLAQKTEGRKSSPACVVRKRVSPVSAQQELPENYGVFDVETQLSAQEVGGWHRADKMRVSVAVLYLAREDRCLSFTEDEMGQLIEQLYSLDLVVGFNNLRFDNKVLSAYTSRRLERLPSLDILTEITTTLGYRLSLDRLAEHTLGEKKSGDGLQALRWFKQGKMEKLAEYCTRDVLITRDLFVHGYNEEYLLFQNKAGKVVRLPVNFAAAVAGVLTGGNGRNKV
jgi:DEAD/DEAH box helicase domain-containing protein